MLKLNSLPKENNITIKVEQDVLFTNIFRLIIEFADKKRKYSVWKFKNITYIQCSDCAFFFTKSEVIYYKKNHSTKLFRAHLNAFRKEYKMGIKAYDKAAGLKLFL